MPTVPITKTEYTKIVDAAVEVFTAQCRAMSGMEVQTGVTEPDVDTAGVLVPGGLPYGVTRANAAGSLWAKLPASAGVESADVVVVS